MPARKRSHRSRQRGGSAVVGRPGRSSLGRSNSGSRTASSQSLSRVIYPSREDRRQHLSFLLKLQQPVTLEEVVLPPWSPNPQALNAKRELLLRRRVSEWPEQLRPLRINRQLRMLIRCQDT